MATETRISSPGKYAGYSEQIYSERVLNSQYVEVRDKTRLAVDIFRPAVNGVAVDAAYPVLLGVTPYRRAFCETDGSVSRYAETYAGGIAELTKYGYVVVALDLRGRGASFGISVARQDWNEAWDIHDVIEWLAAQSWCDGKVGMWGCSYPGADQLRAAATKPPALKAIWWASGATGDMYEKTVRGGVLSDDYNWDKLVSMDEKTVPVDEDADGSMLRDAVSSRPFNTTQEQIESSQPFRDSYVPATGGRFNLDNSPLYYRDLINDTGIGIYHWLTWNDTTESRLRLVDAVNFGSPLKLMIGGFWGHCGGGMTLNGTLRDGTPPEAERIDFFAEHHRFFDYYLKDIDNGLLTEPAVYMYTKGRPAGQEWRFESQWPLEKETRRRLYFDADGGLVFHVPHEGQDEHQVDYTISTKDMATKGLVYETTPLLHDAEITGHPVVHLWVSSTATDGDFFAVLDDIDENGNSVLGPWPHIDGRLRASHRKLSEPEFDNLGLPWHRSFAEDIEPLVPGERTELRFDIMPTSNIFKAGHRIRITISGSMLDGSGRAPGLDDGPAPLITVYRGGEHASFVELPFID
ncbi:MAG: CocE/NonD family hydrolase [Dehalococcoidia bacterium]